MKKKFIYSLMIAAAAAVFSSCSNSLEERPTDAFDEEAAFQGPMLAYVNMATSLYNSMLKIMGNNHHVYDSNTFSSDEAMFPYRIGDWEDGGLWQNTSLHRWGTMNDLAKNSWDFLYEQIGKYNQNVDKLQVFAEEQPDVEYFRVYLEEVCAVRVFLYYELLNLSTRAPLVTSYMTSMSEVKQSERSVVFNFTRSELEETLLYLSNNRSNQKGECYGRITKPVVYMILIKLALNTEVYTDDNWTDGDRPDGKNIKLIVDDKEMNTWKTTIAYVDKLEALGYKLQGNFSENFAVANETSVRDIFTVLIDPVTYPDAKGYNSVHTYHYNYVTTYGQPEWSDPCATVKTMNVLKFGTADKDPRCKFTYFTGEVTGPGGKTIHTEWDRQKVPLKYKPNTPKVYMDVSGDLLVKTAGIRMAKREFDQNAQNGGNLHGNDCVVFHFADTLPTKVETKIHLGQNGDDGMNRVRNRVSAKPLQSVIPDTLLDERMFELAWEGVHRQDLIRFGKFTEITVDRYIDVKHSTNSLDYQEDKTGYAAVFPIYADILSLNPNLTQNPGY